MIQRSVLLLFGGACIATSASAQQSKKKKLRPLPTFDGGKPRVDIADRNALYDFMEGRR